MKLFVPVGVVVVLAFVAGAFVGWAWLPKPQTPEAQVVAPPPTQPTDDEPGVFYFVGPTGSRQVQLPRDYRLTTNQALTIAGVPVANGGFTQNALSVPAQSSAFPEGASYELIRTGEDGRQQTIPFDPANTDPEKIVYLRSRDVIRIRAAGG